MFLLDIIAFLVLIWFVHAIFSILAFLFPGLVCHLVLAGVICSIGWFVINHPVIFLVIMAAVVVGRHMENAE